MKSRFLPAAPEVGADALHARPIRVLQVVDTLGMGGAETWLMEVLRFWNRQSGARTPRMDFLVTSGRRGIFDAEAEALGARIFYLRFGRDELSEFVRGF